MLYAWIGLLKPSSEPIPQMVQELTNDFLAQPFINIQLAGPLRDAAGKRAGMMMIFEHDSLEAARTFVTDSPFLQAGLYENYWLYEYVNESG